jgi:hypothetical protein
MPCVHHTFQIKALDDEINRLERNAKREQSLNIEYLKNIVVKYFESPTSRSRLCSRDVFLLCFFLTYLSVVFLTYLSVVFLFTYLSVVFLFTYLSVVFFSLPFF